MPECKKKALGHTVRHISYSYPILGQRHNACGRISVRASLTNKLVLQFGKIQIAIYIPLQASCKNKTSMKLVYIYMSTSRRYLNQLLLLKVQNHKQLQNHTQLKIHAPSPPNLHQIVPSVSSLPRHRRKHILRTPLIMHKH